MRILVYEHLCANPLPAASSLRVEGMAMLTAALEDLAACPGVVPVTLVEPNLAPVVRERAAGVEVLPVTGQQEETLFRQLAREATFSLVIAPEFDDILAMRCAWAVAEGSKLLGPSPEAVRLTGDKLALAEHLNAHDVSTPPTRACASCPTPPWFPAVCKPRFGAGSQATALVHDQAGYRSYLKGPTYEPIVQPWVPGRPVSVAGMAGQGTLYLLPACEQHLSDDDEFRYLGGRVPVPPDLGERAHQLVRRTVAAVPGLAGYFGFDLLLGDCEDGRNDVVVEINPRLTTSYVGLRRLTRFNLMQALLDAVAGRPLSELAWSDEPVTFTADGSIL